MSARTTAATLAFIAAAAAVSAGPPASAGEGSSGPYAPAAAPTSPCTVHTTKAIDRPIALVGDPVSVTMHASVTCPVEPFPLHVMLALDGSPSMAGQAVLQARQAAATLVRGLEITPTRATRAGAVRFDGGVATLQQLTNNEARVIRAIARLQARREAALGTQGPPVGPGRPTVGPPVTAAPSTPQGQMKHPPDDTRMDLGLRWSLRLLRSGRKDLPREDITEVVVLLSDGRDPAGCGPALEEARRLRSEGVLIIAVCTGPGCDESCMRALASSPRYYYRAENSGALQSIFQEVRDRFLNVVVRELTLLEVPGEALQVDPADAHPAPDSYDPLTGAMTWRYVYVPREGVTVTVRARPLFGGRLAVAQSSGGTWVDNRGRSGAFAFPELWLGSIDTRVPDAGPRPPGGEAEIGDG